MGKIREIEWENREPRIIRHERGFTSSRATLNLAECITHVNEGLTKRNFSHHNCTREEMEANEQYYEELNAGPILKEGAKSTIEFLRENKELIRFGSQEWDC